MILVTSNFVSGYEIETLGLVKGSVITMNGMWFYSISKIFSKLKEKIMFTSMPEVGLQIEEATKRMIFQAQEKQANAIITVRYATVNISDDIRETVVYGTAVKLHKK